MAEACAATLGEMNPHVQLAALPGPVDAALSPERLRHYDLVLLVGQPAWAVSKADQLCRAAGVPFYAAAARGISGWAFADLGPQHEYIVEVGGARCPCCYCLLLLLLLPPATICCCC